MGNVISSARHASTSWWNSSNNGHIPTMTAVEDTEDSKEDLQVDSDGGSSGSSRQESPNTPRTLSPAKAKEMEEFRKQLLIKREARRKIIAERSSEMQKLKQQLEEEKRAREEVINENTRLRALIAQNSSASLGEPVPERNDDIRTSLEDLENQIQEMREQNKCIRCELAKCNLTHQSVVEELTLVNKENIELRKHVDSLKEVNKVSKDMLSIRESQLNQLKEKLLEIEKSLADREMKTLSNDLRSEYERQLENIRSLRLLYEERARVAEVTRQNLLKDLEDQKSLVETHSKKRGELETKIEELEKEVSDKNDILGTKDDQLGLSKAESRGLKAEMTVINQLFSKMLLGYNSNQDLDKLVLKLEENHDLLTDMVVREESSEVASALPKLILDLLTQAEISDKSSDKENVQDNSEIVESSEQEAGGSKGLTSAEEIVGNLPKVWRVLMELLSHQAGPQLILDENDKSASSCYKSVETPAGTRMVPSVSKTYIRLKDLILEKKSLQKEMNSLKQLNGHLENRLQDQERRLGLVSSELSKTWHIVGRMQRQHQQLHSHEQILRFELQQKRLLLTELKEELEYCREKWDMAKQKNSESQIEWDKLRLEFASRKIKSSDSVNNSAESGYSDEKVSDDDSVGSNNEKKMERRRLKKKSKSPEVVESDPTIVNKNLNISTDVPNDSDDVADNSTDGEEPVSIGAEEKPPDSVEVSQQGSRLNSAEKDLAAAGPSTSNTSNGTNYDEVLASRSARLKKLEEQCYVLVHKVTKTNKKGIELCNRLEELHNQYGGSEEESSGQSSVEKEVPTVVSKDDQTESLNANVEDGQIESCSNANTTDSLSTNTEDKGGTTDDIERDKISGNIDIETTKVDQPESSLPTTSTGKYDYEARFAARDARFELMEEQAKSLVKQVSNTSNRSIEMCTKLTDLHNTYGRSEEEDVNNNLSEESAQVNVIVNVVNDDALTMNVTLIPDTSILSPVEEETSSSNELNPSQSNDTV
ncbi:uncharacterized protein LOC143912702 [Arctopsyche grandis]|uniref:uncharacterized protein LOC143912702 n=1 Tax=Arctopsyche grandis TaxID=121162 RepID=UPI00406D8CDB